MMIKSVGKEDSNKIETVQWQKRQMVIEGKASSAGGPSAKRRDCAFIY